MQLLTAQEQQALLQYLLDTILSSLFKTLSSGYHPQHSVLRTYILSFEFVPQYEHLEVLFLDPSHTGLNMVLISKTFVGTIPNLLLEDLTGQVAIEFNKRVPKHFSYRGRRVSKPEYLLVHKKQDKNMFHYHFERKLKRKKR